MLTLARALVDYDLDLLQAIAGQWDIDLTSSDRGLAAEELAAAMLDPEAIHSTWERLGEEAQEALSNLLANEGRLPFAHFTRRYGEIRPMGPARRERERPWTAPISVTEALFYRGLIVRAFEQSTGGAQEFIVVPSDLAEGLPRPELTSTTRSPGYPVAPPRQVPVGKYAAPDDLATLLAYLLIREDNARPWLETTPSDIIDRYLRRPIPAYRAMLTHLAYDLDLIEDLEVLTQTTTQVNKDSARPWLEAPILHQLRSLAETWLESTTWNDLAFTPGLDADEWPNDPRLARQVVLDTLQDVPAGLWWSLHGLVEHIKQHAPDFQRPGGDYAAWYLRDAVSGEILHGFQYWDYIEGEQLRFIIGGPLTWLGLVQAGQGAFMVTELGQALLGQTDWPSAPDRETRIRVDQQGVISVPVQMSRYERAQIARFTAWLDPPPLRAGDPDADGGDAAYRYRLTPQAIARVADEGFNLGRIITFLQRLSGGSVPPNVLKMLQSWGENPAEVVVEDAVIIRAKDLGVYERLVKNQRVHRWFVQQVGPNSYTVRREDLPALLNALREMGILPYFEGYKKDDWP
ncbi:MAG: hypothetical protein P8Z40_13550 [Chloroflexota bacterium]